MVVIVWQVDLQLHIQSVPLWYLSPLSTIFQLYGDSVLLVGETGVSEENQRVKHQNITLTSKNGHLLLTNTLLIDYVIDKFIIFIVEN
jgi:hypothetical protein